MATVSSRDNQILLCPDDKTDCIAISRDDIAKMIDMMFYPDSVDAFTRDDLVTVLEVFNCVKSTLRDGGLIICNSYENIV